MNDRELSVRGSPAETSRIRLLGDRWNDAVRRVSRRMWWRLGKVAAWLWCHVAMRCASGAAPAGGDLPWVSMFGGESPAFGDLMTGGPPGQSERAAGIAMKVRQLLNALGAAPGDVAAALVAAGVRSGPPGAGTTPIAGYLWAVVGADPGVHALVCDRDTVTVTDGTGRSVTVALPSTVVTFTEAFEHGCYPELDRPARDVQRIARGGCTC